MKLLIPLKGLETLDLSFLYKYQKRNNTSSFDALKNTNYRALSIFLSSLPHSCHNGETHGYTTSTKPQMGSANPEKRFPSPQQNFYLQTRCLPMGPSTGTVVGFGTHSPSSSHLPNLRRFTHPICHRNHSSEKRSSRRTETDHSVITGPDPSVPGSIYYPDRHNRVSGSETYGWTDSMPT